MSKKSPFDIGGLRVRLDGYLSRLPKGYALGNAEGRALGVRFAKDIDALYVDSDVSCEGILKFADNDIPFLACDKITHKES